MGHMGRAAYVLAQVVHHLVIAAGGVDLGDDAGLQAVHQLAQDDAVSQYRLIGHCNGKRDVSALRTMEYEYSALTSPVLWQASSAYLQGGTAPR